MTFNTNLSAVSLEAVDTSLLPTYGTHFTNDTELTGPGALFLDDSTEHQSVVRNGSFLRSSEDDFILAIAPTSTLTGDYGGLAASVELLGLNNTLQITDVYSGISGTIGTRRNLTFGDGDDRLLIETEGYGIHLGHGKLRTNDGRDLIKVVNTDNSIDDRIRKSTILLGAGDDEIYARGSSLFKCAQESTFFGMDGDDLFDFGFGENDVRGGDGFDTVVIDTEYYGISITSDIPESVPPLDGSELSIDLSDGSRIEMSFSGTLGVFGQWDLWRTSQPSDQEIPGTVIEEGVLDDLPVLGSDETYESDYDPFLDIDFSTLPELPEAPEPQLMSFREIEQLVIGGRTIDLTLPVDPPEPIVETEPEPDLIPEPLVENTDDSSQPLVEEDAPILDLAPSLEEVVPVTEEVNPELQIISPSVVDDTSEEIVENHIQQIDYELPQSQEPEPVQDSSPAQAPVIQEQPSDDPEPSNTPITPVTPSNDPISIDTISPPPTPSDPPAPLLEPLPVPIVQPLPPVIPTPEPELTIEPELPIEFIPTPDPVVHAVAEPELIIEKNDPLIGSTQVNPINETNVELSVLSASVDEDILSVEFDQLLDPGKIGRKRFRVKEDGDRVKVKSAFVYSDDPTTALITLKSPIIDDELNVHLNYHDPKGDQSKKIIEDFLGNDLESFKNLPVEIL